MSRLALFEDEDDDESIDLRNRRSLTNRFGSLGSLGAGRSARDGNVIEPGCVLAQNLLLHFHRYLPRFSSQILGQLQVHEFLDYPFRLPQRVIASEKNAIRP